VSIEVPKRILSLDGGGVRGLLSLAFLEEIERILASRTSSPEDFRLCDHFDLVGGTSTGSLIATSIALGYRVSELVESYITLSHKAFRGSRWHGGVFAPKFRSADLLAQIRGQVGNETLGSEKLRTGLAVVSKRIDTGSPWIFHNNRSGRYFNAPADDAGAFPNRDIPLEAILRASTAAPTYYEPESIRIHEDLEGLFIDGGVSPFNNPALLMFQMATTQAYGYGWPTGVDRLQLVSIGAGITSGLPTTQPSRMLSGALGLYALRSIMTDCSWQAQGLLQWFGHCPQPWVIDSEMGTLADESLASHPLLTYLRYDVELTPEWLERELGMNLSQKEVRTLTNIDRPELCDTYLQIGRRAAGIQVNASHV